MQADKTAGQSGHILVSNKKQLGNRETGPSRGDLSKMGAGARAPARRVSEETVALVFQVTVFDLGCRPEGTDQALIFPLALHAALALTDLRQQLGSLLGSADGN